MATHTTLFVVTLIWEIIVSFLHVLGIICIISIRKKWKNQHKILLNLSVSVLFLMLISIPCNVYIFLIYKDHVSKNFYQSLPTLYNVAFGFYFLCCVSYFLSLSLMTLDRLIAVLKPHKYRQMYSKKRCSYTIFGSWIISLILVLSLYVLRLLYWLFKLQTVLVSVSFLFYIVSYTMIFYYVYQMRTNVSVNVSRFNKKTLIVPISVVVSSFLFYVIPLVSWTFTKYIDVHTTHAIYISIIYFGVLLDAVLYISFQPNIKHAFTDMFKRRRVSIGQSA